MKDYRNIDNQFPPIKYLSDLNILLIEKVFDWAENDSDIHRLLIEIETSFIFITIEKFRVFLCEKFPSRIIESIFISFDIEISDLHQKFEEFLISYYKRIYNLMQRINIKNRFIIIQITISLFTLEAIMFNIIFRAFLKGFNNHDIRKKIIRDMISIDRSFYMIYNFAEKVRKINLKIQKLFDEEFRLYEFKFYKSLVEKKMLKHQIASLFSEYHALKDFQKK